MMMKMIQPRQRRSDDEDDASWTVHNDIIENDDAKGDIDDDDNIADDEAMYDFDYNDSSASEEGDGDDAVYYTLPETAEESVFDRRERLDVKKPGPFFTHSQNNFFLDKVSFQLILFTTL
jgi:hypothetical protein